MYLQIQFWKINNSADYRTDDVIFRVWNPCPLVAVGNKQVLAVTSLAVPQPVYQPVIVSGATNRLWPYSRLAAAVRTMNGATGGNLSNIVVFDTPEGGLCCSARRNCTVNDRTGPDFSDQDNMKLCYRRRTARRDVSVEILSTAAQL